MISAKLLIATTVISSVLFANSLLAAQWQSEVGISAGSFYSDNICRRNSNSEEHVAGTATPDISLRKHGARANLVLRGAVEFNTLSVIKPDCRSGGAGNVPAAIPSLRFAGDLELIDEWLTLEADAFAGRNRTNPFVAGDDIDGRDNIFITYQYGAGATVQRRLLNRAAMRLRYRHSEQFNDAALLGNNRQEQAEFSLGTDRGRAQFSSGVSGRYRKAYYEESRQSPAFDNTLSSAEVWAALQLTRALEINALAGDEWNEFTSADEDIDGSYWDVGLAWTPNERMEFGVGTGERFFGTTSRFNVRYRHKRSVLSANYAHTLVFPSDLRAGLGAPIDPISDGPENHGFDSGFGLLAGETPVERGDPTFISDGPIIDKRFTLRYGLTGRRSALSVSASESQQLRTEDNATATFTHVGATLSHDLSAHLTADVRLNWSEREGQGGDVGPFGEHSETWRFGPGISRLLGPNTTVTLRHEHTRQRSDFSQNQYDENRITLSFRHVFRPISR